MVKGVIFDFDGVVVDSLSLHLKAWEQATQLVIGETLVDSQQYIGHSTTTIAHLIAQRFQKPSLASELSRLKKKLLSNSAAHPLMLPGTKECFTALTEHHIPFGIASNAPKAFIFSTLQALSLHVPIIVGVEDVLHPKPAPDVFILCAAKLGFTHEDYSELVVLEDSIHGLQAAIRAGMTTVGVTSQASGETLIAAGAHATCPYPWDYLKDII